MKKHLEKIVSSKYHVPVAVVLGVTLFAVGIFLGEYKEEMEVKKYIGSFQNLRDEDRHFSFISPLLGVASAPATDIGLYTDIKSQINDYFDSEKRKGNLYDDSFYFKDLTSPLWYGIDEDHSFAPASLFKLPIAIIAYRQGEVEPDFLKKELTYTQAMSDANKSIPGNEDTTLVVGNTYQVEDLIKIMLELSDNGAKDLLSSAIDEKYVTELFKVTALIDPSAAQSYQISSRKYALFLRLLYNGSYLKPKHSEYILSVLAKSTFNDGLVAGLPQGLVVAHKFGVHDSTQVVDGKTVPSTVLHDCGIVYYSDSPYALCIMTEGRDVQTLEKIISTVSKMVYDDAATDR